MPSERQLRELLTASAGVFAAAGYRRAQLDDIAAAARMAKGSLYAYAAGKEALFAATVQYGDAIEPASAQDLPFAATGWPALASVMGERLSAVADDIGLHRLAESAPIGSAGAELGDVVTRLYGALARNRVAIKLVDRSANEIGELGHMWQTARLEQLQALERYLSLRSATGSLELPGPAGLFARTVVEACAHWAVHCPFAPGDPAAATEIQDQVVATLGQTFVRATRPATGKD